MEQECFYKENRRARTEQEILLTERMSEVGEETLWRIRPMSQRENEEIWRRSGGDESRYEREIMAESVCFPDLKNAALQDSYGVAGAARLLERLLLAGEYERLRQAVEEINGGESGCTDCI